MSEAEGLPRTSSAGAGTVVRRIILFVILFWLVEVAVIGLSGLIERLFPAARFAGGDDSGLALSLAFTLIGVPLVAVLWWWQRRRLIADAGERASLVWALYLTAMTLTSLISATVALAIVATAGIDGEWRPGEFASGVVWAGVWLWHRQMRRNSSTAPTRLPDLPIELSALYGLVVGAVGAIGATGAVISQALDTQVLVSSQNWLTPVFQASVWCAIGVLVWWWHWFSERANTARGRFAAVLLVIVVGAAAATTLFSVGMTLFVVLRLLFDTDPAAEVLAPLGTALAAALVGGVVWVYHARVLATRSDQTQRSGRLVVSAVALIGAAAGFGVIVNALLATLGDTLVDDDPRTLLLGGISALVIGGPVWWLAWRPGRRTAADAADPARRVYLVAVFGASAVVGLITLLIIGYGVFQFALGVTGGTSLVEHIRVPLGLLSATAIVFGYHFAVWRRDRAVAPKSSRREIGRIILVASGDSSEHAAQIRSATGAPVTVWPAANGGAPLGDGDLAALLESLTGLSAPRVLIVAAPGGGVTVVPLAE